MRGCRSVEGERRGEKGSKCSRIRARTGRKDRRLASVSLLMMYILFFSITYGETKNGELLYNFSAIIEQQFLSGII